MRLASVERFEELLLAVPELVAGLRAEDALAAGPIDEWLAEVERQLSALRLPASATFATLRGRLWSVGRGLRLPGLQLTRAPTARNWRRVGTSAILDEATQTLSALLAPSRAAIADVSDALRQAVELGRIRERVGGPALPWHDPEALWGALLTDQDLTVFVTRAASVLGEPDARTLLARAAAQEPEAQPPASGAAGRPEVELPAGAAEEDEPALELPPARA
ncbi:MAG TPA: hypothetical protein VK756_03610 [Solirubrobacteraceae bacterium]|jgi:hypothetical protein|nr:hypothetical protein [Solirubrobacteraceae bacterium]